MKNRPRILTYCMASVARTAHQATGAWPVLCPPFGADTFPVEFFERADLIWLGLHGVGDNPRHLFGDQVTLPGMVVPMRTRALTAQDLVGLNLRGRVVYATTCYLDQTDFPAVLKKAGATVIGGPGKNYGDTGKLVGADKLGAAFVGALRTTTTTIAAALDEAKRTLDLQLEADRDAAEFAII